jgi:pyruvate kinase
LLQGVHAQHQLSARNLLYYLALRSHDLRPLQARLASAGLSSLGRAAFRPRSGYVLSRRHRT